MSFEQIRHRLSEGRPLVVDSDTGASFRARGVLLNTPGALGQLLREKPSEVEAHYRAEIESRVDILSALTADTTPRALAEVGMEHRAAQLTSRAVELAIDASYENAKPVAVAGVLGSDMVSPVAADRLHEELIEHAARLAAAGCELMIARGQGSRLGLMAAVVAASRTDLPTWAVMECGSTGNSTEGDPHELIASLAEAGADILLFEVPQIEIGLRQLERFKSALEQHGMFPGVLLAASENAVRGFDDALSDPEHWVERALDLSIGGARVIGGGAGTTEAHTRALALALGSLHPSVPARHSDAELDRERGSW
ncbi:MAG TPA: homocysteine S-methyltransferase family protein [Polyangiaceae bacterium]|nr:homocysteine S-methyltransferase family protein [Polyangiaceae bacterium]